MISIHGTGNNGFWPFIGFGAGLWIFYRGLSLYRKTLLVADTPTVPIRSAAMGVVQVHGAATGDGSFPSPISGVPCYAFKVVIERWTDEGRSSGWKHYRTDMNGGKFYLEDQTGHVLVDPRGIEYDLPKNCRRTVPEGMTDSMFDHQADMPDLDETTAASFKPRSDEDLLTYAEGPYSTRVRRFRFTEYCVQPKHEYDVLGTCTENPHPNGDDDNNLIMKGQNERTYLISSKAAEQLASSFRWKSALMVLGGVALTGVCAMVLLNQFGLW